MMFFIPSAGSSLREFVSRISSVASQSTAVIRTSTRPLSSVGSKGTTASCATASSGPTGASARTSPPSGTVCSVATSSSPGEGGPCSARIPKKPPTPSSSPAITETAATAT